MNAERTRRERTFDAMFRRSRDPWSFETSAYERRKRRTTLAAIQGTRFDRGLEIGCANGVLTASLARVCDNLLALDVSAEAIALAHSRLAGFDNVELRRAEVPRDWPDGTFDLIVLSEVLYFLDEDEIVRTSGHALASLSQGGVCLLVNWTGPSDLPLDGDATVDLFRHAAGWLRLASVEKDSYRIDLLAAPRHRARPLTMVV